MFLFSLHDSYLLIFISFHFSFCLRLKGTSGICKPVIFLLRTAVMFRLGRRSGF